MEGNNVWMWGLAVLMVLGGLAGAVLPALPGVPLVFEASASGCTPDPTGWNWTATGGATVTAATTRTASIVFPSTLMFTLISDPRPAYSERDALDTGESGQRFSSMCRSNSFLNFWT